MLTANILIILLLTGTTNQEQNTWQLVWRDEFNQPTIDRNSWKFEHGQGCIEIGACGWGNKELQYYTNRTQNAFLKDGLLVVQALREDFAGVHYTSARLVSKRNWKYGKIQAKVKFPIGNGIMTSIWMLPTYNRYGRWPSSGEIDIAVMTPLYNGIYSNRNGRNTYSAVIYGRHYKDKVVVEDEYRAPLGLPVFSEGFYIYELEWSADGFKWFVNGENVHNFSRNEMERGYEYPFDERFHLVMNLAVGGEISGEPHKTMLPKRLEIDYVRVFQMM